LYGGNTVPSSLSRGLKVATPPPPPELLPPGQQPAGRANFMLSSLIRKTVGGKYETVNRPSGQILKRKKKIYFYLCFCLTENIYICVCAYTNVPACR
jgi:hypothetical protein